MYAEVEAPKSKMTPMKHNGDMQKKNWRDKL